jgi:hypothetical protein
LQQLAAVILVALELVLVEVLVEDLLLSGLGLLRRLSRRLDDADLVVGQRIDDVVEAEGERLVGANHRHWRDQLRLGITGAADMDAKEALRQRIGAERGGAERRRGRNIGGGLDARRLDMRGVGDRASADQGSRLQGGCDAQP